MVYARRSARRTIDDRADFGKFGSASVRAGGLESASCVPLDADPACPTRATSLAVPAGYLRTMQSSTAQRCKLAPSTTKQCQMTLWKLSRSQTWKMMPEEYATPPASNSHSVLGGRVVASEWKINNPLQPIPPYRKSARRPKCCGTIS